jgi:hypothetical protein
VAGVVDGGGALALLVVTVGVGVAVVGAGVGVAVVGAAVGLLVVGVGVGVLVVGAVVGVVAAVVGAEVEALGVTDCFTELVVTAGDVAVVGNSAAAWGPQVTVYTAGLDDTTAGLVTTSTTFPDAGTQAGKVSGLAACVPGPLKISWTGVVFSPLDIAQWKVTVPAFLAVIVPVMVMVGCGAEHEEKASPAGFAVADTAMSLFAVVHVSW